MKMIERHPHNTLHVARNGFLSSPVSLPQLLGKINGGRSKNAPPRIRKHGMGDAKDDLGDCFYGLGDRKNSRPNCKTAVWTRKKPPRGSPSHFAKQRYNKKSRNASGLFRPNPSQKRRQRGRVFQKQGRGSTLKPAGQQAGKSSSSQGGARERGRDRHNTLFYTTYTILYI